MCPCDYNSQDTLKYPQGESKTWCIILKGEFALPAALAKTSLVPRPPPFSLNANRRTKNGGGLGTRLG